MAKIDSDAARRAAVEAARRAAAEAARRAAELAAKKAAEAAAKKLAEAAAKKKAKGFGKDEMSSGRGGALRRAATALLGAQGLPSVIAPKSAAAAVKAPEVKAPELTTSQRAQQDAGQVKKAYDDELAKSGNEARAANNAAQTLRRLTNDNSDPAYVNELVRASGPTVDKITDVYAKNVGEKKFSSGADKDVLKDSLRALSDVAARGAPAAAYNLGQKIADKLPNKGDLMQVDDAFYDHVGAGGDPALMRATAQFLGQQGKGDALDDLKHGHDSLLDKVGNAIGGALDFGKDVLGFVEGAAGTAVKIATSVGEFGLDAAKGTLSAVGDVANWTTDKVTGAVSYAVEHGLKLEGAILEKAHEVAGSALDKAVGLEDNINSLKPGDSYKLGASGSASIGVGGNAKGDIEVKKNEDGSYSVSAQAQADIGLKFLAHAEAGLGGRMEMKFDNPADAKRAAELLATSAAGMVNPALAPLTQMSPGEADFISKHLKSVEVDANVGAGLDAKAGIPGLDDKGVAGNVHLTAGYKVEFDDGKPVALVKTTKLDEEGSASLVDQNLKKQGIEFDGKASASVTLESRVPIDASRAGDLAQLLTDPAGGLLTHDSVNTLTTHGEWSNDGKGHQVDGTISNIKADALPGILDHVKSGDFEGALKGSGLVIASKEADFKDSADERGVDASIWGVGASFEVHSGVRRVENQKTGEVRY